ncbi:MAG TPA: sugar ABC transporter permease [Rubrobacter sp.]
MAVTQRKGKPAALRREALTAYLLISPNLIVFGVFMLLPLILTFVISAQETSGLGPAEWVGLGNYTELISDGVFWRSLINTVGYAAVTVPLGLALGLAVAMLLNNAVWLRDVMRTIYYLPVVISGVAAGLIAQWMFNENIGVVNELLGLVGLGPVSWQSSPAWAMTSVVLLTLWVGVGFNMVVYLAALQGIPREYYDASAVDGANSVQQFRHVTLPGLGTATVFLAIYGVILSFQAFDLIYILTGGGPGSATEVLGTYAYEQAFSARERGYGSAIGVVLYLLLIVVLSVQFWISRRRDPEEG